MASDQAILGEMFFYEAPIGAGIVVCDRETAIESQVGTSIPRALVKVSETHVSSSALGENPVEFEHSIDTTVFAFDLLTLADVALAKFRIENRQQRHAHRRNENVTRRRKK